jgi:hypothetical protein
MWIQGPPMRNPHEERDSQRASIPLVSQEIRKCTAQMWEVGLSLPFCRQFDKIRAGTRKEEVKGSG